MSKESLVFRANRKVRYIYSKMRIKVNSCLGVLFGSKYTRHPLDIAVFDDIFPSIYSQFRLLEYQKYFDRYNAHVFSSNLYFGKLKREYIAYYKGHYDRIHRFKGLPVKAKMAYFIFANNGVEFIDFIEKNKLKFVFTLYPGGGFGLNNPVSDEKLRRLFDSPYFYKVLVTQNITHKYLLDHHFCGADKIVRVAGSPYKMPHAIERKDKGRTTFDVVFCAAKYMPAGYDKGYDLFVETVRLLKDSIPNLRAHVIGPYDASDYPIEDLIGVMVFHGTQPVDDLRQIFSGADIALSPNRNNVLWPGAFDGFPTGAVGLGAMEGAAMFVTDPLGQNEFFKPDQQIVIINHNPRDIADKILYYYRDPALLRKIGEQGQARAIELTSDAVQMPVRYQTLDKLIQESHV